MFGRCPDTRARTAMFCRRQGKFSGPHKEPDSVDEKPSIQAIERASGYVETDSSKVVRGLKSTYKRHGTLNLFAALEVGTGQVKTKFTEYKKREDFRSFLDDVLADQPQDKEIHVILD